MLKNIQKSLFSAHFAENNGAILRKMCGEYLTEAFACYASLAV